MIFSASRFVVVDDNAKHLQAISNAFQQIGTPCIGVQYDLKEQMNPDLFRGVRCLFLDLHLTGGQIGTDHKGDFARIQTILEDNINKRGGPFVLVMWTQHPHLRGELVDYLDANLDKTLPYVRPLAVLCLAKEAFIGADDQVTAAEDLRVAVKAAVTENAQLAALLGWEVDVLAAAADTLAELIKLVPNDQNTIEKFPNALDTILSRLASEAVGKSNVGIDCRAAITSALGPILSDRIINQDVSNEMSAVWSQAVTKYDDAQLPPVSENEAGGINRMLHLAIPGSEKIRPTDWGVVLNMPTYIWDKDEIFRQTFDCSRTELLEKEFKLKATDHAICRPCLVRIGAACDYAQTNRGPITYLFGIEIPVNIKRNSPPAAEWKSPIFTREGIAVPFRLHVNVRFGMSIVANNCAAWAVQYRLREQLLMYLISHASNYISRPGIVSLNTK